VRAQCPLRALALFALLLASVAVAQPLRVIYPQSESRLDGRTIFPIAVLQLALEHSGREYSMQPSAAKMQQSRSLRLLAQGDRLDVLWTVTTPEREKLLRPIRIPIDRGLLGWRILLIHHGDALRFAAVDSVAALARLLGGQGHDWPDLGILHANGLRVATSPTYDGLFAMLARQHIDYLPRGISEIDRELERHTNEPIEIERTLLLHYPLPLYFFVNQRNYALAEAIENGLEHCIADGSLQAMIGERFGPLLTNLDLQSRRVLELRNPDLPDQTPLQRRELWMDVESTR